MTKNTYSNKDGSVFGFEYIKSNKVKFSNS